MLFIKNWWLLALRGISSIIFGFYFFTYPDLTLVLLFKGFCLYAFADGVFSILAALFSARNKALRLIFLIVGFVSIAAGTVALYQPFAASIALLLSVGLWAAFTGVLEIAAGFLLDIEIKGRGWLKISGVVSLVIGAFLLVQPFTNFMTLAALIGIFQIFRGIVNLLISLGIRRNRKEIEIELEGLAKS